MHVEMQGEPLPKTRILVVEDDRSSRTALVALLRLSGFEPLPAGTVSEGLDQLDRSPRCIILDLMLPDGNGSSILGMVRARKLPIHIAVTTGASNWESMLEAAPEPPDAVFPKPIDFQRLIEWIQTRCTADA